MSSANVVALKAGGSIAGIVPQSFEDVYRIARCISESGLAPAGMRTPEQVTVAILTGLEIGLPPMFAIQKIAVINGRPSVWGDAIPALLWARGFKLREWAEGSGEAAIAHCEVARPDGEKIVRSFDVAKARKAGLWGKTGPWSQHPERMLQMRARGLACRDGAADVLSGLYLREEIDEPMRDITPVKQIAALEIPDDIPDSQGPRTGTNGAEKPATDTKVTAREPDNEPDEQIANPDSILSKIEDDIALCTSVEDLSQVEQQYADLLPRLSKAHQKKAAKLFADAKE